MQQCHPDGMTSVPRDWCHDIWECGKMNLGYVKVQRKLKVNVLILYLINYIHTTFKFFTKLQILLDKDIIHAYLYSVY